MSKVQIINGDCMEAMAQMPDKAYELAIVDPPYFSGPDKLGYFGAIYSTTKIKRQNYKILGKWNVPEQCYFDELLRVSSNQIIWGFNYFNINYIGSGRIIWDKVNDLSTFSDCEIAYNSQHDHVKIYRYMWNGMLQGNMKQKEVRIHPTQKPVALYQWLLKNYAKPGDRILDTHGGSCSLAIACDIMGYDCDIYEIDKDYYEAALDRFNRHKQQTVLAI